MAATKHAVIGNRSVYTGVGFGGREGAWRLLHLQSFVLSYATRAIAINAQFKSSEHFIFESIVWAATYY